MWGSAGKAVASEGDAPPQLPGPLAQIIPKEVAENATQLFLLSGLVLAFTHRDKIIAGVRRVLRRK